MPALPSPEKSLPPRKGSSDRDFLASLLFSIVAFGLLFVALGALPAKKSMRWWNLKVLLLLGVIVAGVLLYLNDEPPQQPALPPEM